MTEVKIQGHSRPRPQTDGYTTVGRGCGTIPVENVPIHGPGVGRSGERPVGSVVLHIAPL